MRKHKPAMTATHYAAASFVAAFFSVIGVLAVIGGTASGEAKEPGKAPAATEREELNTNDDDDARPERDRPFRRGPEGRFGPPSFDEFDTDGDGNITRGEFDEFRATHRPPRGPQPHARGEIGGRGGGFDGPPRGRRGGTGEFRRGPGGEHGPGGFDRPGRPGRGHFEGPTRGPRGERGEFLGGPGGGPGHHGPPPHMRGRERGEFRQGPPPRLRGGEGPRGARGGRGGFRGGPDFGQGPGDFDRRPPRPDFNQLDADGDGSISKQEFDDFRPPRGPRGPLRDDADLPREESF